jgi:hypothetical protein
MSRMGVRKERSGEGSDRTEGRTSREGSHGFLLGRGKLFFTIMLHIMLSVNNKQDSALMRDDEKFFFSIFDLFLTKKISLLLYKARNQLAKI